MNIIFLMKPLSTVLRNKDTSLLFMQACQYHDANLYFCSQNNASITTEGVVFDVQRFSCNESEKLPIFNYHEKKILHESEVHSIFIRTDPPFDQRYLNDMWILEQVKAPINFVNHPKGIKDVNEKIWVSQFKDIIPKTCISSNKNRLYSFLDKYKKIILKPTDGFGGNSICLVDKNDPNKNVLFEMMTQNFSSYVVAQEYLSDAQNGDKRILLVDGIPFASILRFHSNDDHRNNFFAGGKAKLSSITQNDKMLISKISPYLKSLGLRFVGIDIISNFIIEINVTSPTCLQEYNILNDSQTHFEVVKKLLNL